MIRGGVYHGMTAFTTPKLATLPIAYYPMCHLAFQPTVTQFQVCINHPYDHQEITPLYSCAICDIIQNNASLVIYIFNIASSLAMQGTLLKSCQNCPQRGLYRSARTKLRKSADYSCGTNYLRRHTKSCTTMRYHTNVRIFGRKPAASAVPLYAFWIAIARVNNII